MADATIDRSATSNIFHVFIGNSSVTTGAGLTGLSNASSGLIISAMKPGDASATVYSVASSNVETITTIGTYAAPTSGKIRFKEIDSTNRPGWYEFHPANALFSVSSDTTVTFTFIGATNMRATSFTVQVGSPANMVRINGSLTDGSPAEASRPALYLSHLNASNPSGNGVTFQSTATSGSYHGLYAQGAGSGAGFRGTGGNGTTNVAATAGAGFEMAGGISSGSPSGTSEWGGPAIRVLGNWAPAFTIKGDAGPFALLSIFADASGTHTGDAVALSPRLSGHCVGLYPGTTSTSTVFFSTSSNASNIAMDVGGGSNAGAIRLTGGYGMTGSIIGNITGNLSGNVGGNVVGTVGGLNGPITGLLSDSIDVTASTANTVTCGALAGIYPDDHFNNFVLVCSNYNTAVVTDYVGATGQFTIRCLQTDGNWLSNPDAGTPDMIQFTSLPFELKSSITTAILDGVIESGISASSSLTNDTGTQLTSINLQQAIALIASAVVGKLAGAATTNITTKQVGKPSGNTRIDATVDSSGNRSSLTLKVPD